MKPRKIVLISIFAAMYIAIGLVIPPQFGAIQCRVSDALYPLIAVFGSTALYGLALGHATYNLYGFTMGAALGPLDVIISPLLFLIPKYAIKRFGLRAVPLHVLFISLWVPFLICLIGYAPWQAYSAVVLSVASGESVAEIIMGVPLALAVTKTGIGEWVKE